MEKLEPKKQRSPIQSLKFQRKSDYKKFRNFIKKETKELKGIVEPKDDKLKNVLKVGAGGLGILALGSLFGGKGMFGKGDKGEKFPFAIGRVTTTPPKSLPFYKPKPKRPKSMGSKLKKLTKRGTRTFPRPPKVTASKPTARRVIKKRMSPSISFGDIEGEKLRPLKRTVSRTTQLTENQIKSLSSSITGDAKGTKSGSGIKYGSGDARFESGSFDVGNTERDFSNRGRKITKKFASNDPNANIPRSIIREVKRIRDKLRRINKENNPSTVKRLESRLKDIQKNAKIFDKTRPGVYNISNPDPFNRFNVADNPMISKNPFKKGFMKNIFKSKVTKDTIFNLPTKGKVFTKVGKIGAFFNHPIPKGISFILTAYEAYQEGKNINPFSKDNLFTRLYDLGVAINNELIHPDDPSKMKLFISESSNDKLKKLDLMRNAKILELRRQQKQENSGGNNVIVVPENKENNQVKNNIPIKRGENNISFVPFQPLNSVGTDVLLHKLNQ